jgi:apolipoprotein N-acyltransferase
MLRHFRQIFLAASTATLLVAPFHWGELAFLAFFALVPYFFALDGKSPSEAFRFSMGTGALFFLALSYWLTLVTLPGYLLLSAYLAVYFALFGWLCAYFLNPSNEIARTYFRQNMRALFFIPAFWVVLEYLRGIVFSGLPWALLGYGQWKNLVFIQIADLTGVYGVSFFIVFVNLAIFKILKEFLAKPRPADPIDTESQPKYRLALVGTLAAAFAFIALYGIVRIASIESAKPLRTARLSVVQGNIPQDQKWNAKIKNIIFQKYKRLTLMSALDKPDLIVWPETSFPGYLEDEPVMATHLRAAVRQSQTDVLVGVPTIGGIEGGKGLRFYNSAVHYGRDGEEKKRYSKLHLVPFGEYVPLETLIGFIRNFVKIGRFHPGTEKTIFETSLRSAGKGEKARFAVLICFEDIFPSLTRSFAKEADFLVNVTNDAWFGRTTAPYQHAQASVLRAVENRMPVIRAANTGLSCFISASGRILATVQDKGREIMVTGHRTSDIELSSGKSFYTRFGDVFAYFCFFLCYLAFRERTKHSAYSRL